MATTYNFPDAINNNTFDGVQFQINVNGSPLNLTGASCVMVLDFGSYPVTYSNENRAITITSASSGILEFNKQIINLPGYGTYPYDITFKLSDATVKTYINGTWTILKE